MGTGRNATPVVCCTAYGASRHLFSASGFLDTVRDPTVTFDYREQADARREPNALPGAYDLLALARDDLRAVVDFTRAHTDVAQVDLVGFSMGGIIAALYATVVAPQHVRRIVLVGTPIDWQSVPLWAALLTMAPSLIAQLPTAQLHRLLQLVAPLAPYVPNIFLPRWARNGGVDWTAHRELAQAVGALTPDLNRAVCAWVNSGTLMVDGISLPDRLYHSAVPRLGIVGLDDQFAPPKNVASGFRQNGNPRSHRQLVTLDDADHTSLFLGRIATQRVFPAIVRFLASELG